MSRDPVWDADPVSRIPPKSPEVGTQQIQTGTTEKGEVVIVIPANVFVTVSTERDVMLTFTATQARSLGRKLDDLAWSLAGKQFADEVTS